MQLIRLKMVNRDLINVKEGIDKMSDLVNVANINFAIEIARINDYVERELNIIRKGRKKPSEKYQEFLKEQEVLNMKYAIQKEDGTLQMVNGNILIRNPKAYHEEYSILKDKYKEEIKEQEKIDKEFEEFLDSPVKTTIPKISKSLFPASVTVEQVKLLFSVIEL
mgnify:CR=1 FL=1